MVLWMELLARNEGDRIHLVYHLITLIGTVYQLDLTESDINM